MRKETCPKCGRVYELPDNEGLATCICECCKAPSEEQIYNQLKELLRREGWQEQRGGEGNMNGELGTNFMKNDTMIGVSFNDCPDEETLDDLFGSEDDMAPSIIPLSPTLAEQDEGTTFSDMDEGFCDDDDDAINEPEDD